jgi:hypothetical protein
VQRPRANEGGREEEENRPWISDVRLEAERRLHNRETMTLAGYSGQ